MSSPAKSTVQTYTPPAAADEVMSLADLLKNEQAQANVTARPLPAKEGVVPEVGGRTDGPEPTRYGDWEKNGRCIDF